MHQRLVPGLAPSSAAWAPTASLLIACLAHRYVEDTDWEYSEFALYDLGQAVAHITLQAEALGLSARQFRAFDRAALTAEFAVPAHWAITTMIAVGQAAAAPAPVPAAERTPPPQRQRKALRDITWPVT